MASLGKVVTNEKRKALVAKYAARLEAAKATLASPTASVEEKARARQALDKIPRNAHPERVRNRCATTGRPRAFLRKFGLCRNELRRLGLNGHIPGLIKSSW
jgi:small subunit ribosomal protein S14